MTSSGLILWCESVFKAKSFLDSTIGLDLGARTENAISDSIFASQRNIYKREDQKGVSLKSSWQRRNVSNCLLAIRWFYLDILHLLGTAKIDSLVKIGLSQSFLAVTSPRKTRTLRRTMTIKPLIHPLKTTGMRCLSFHSPTSLSTMHRTGGTSTKRL